MADPNDMASAAERLLRSYQASAAGYGQMSGQFGMAQQQQAAAALQSAQLAQLAAAYSNPMAAASLYNPYAAMYAFGGAGGNPFGGNMGWQGMVSPEYMMRMVAVQQQQQVLQQQQQNQAALAAAATTESFSDLLRKIQPPDNRAASRASESRKSAEHFETTPIRERPDSAKSQLHNILDSRSGPESAGESMSSPSTSSVICSGTGIASKSKIMNSISTPSSKGISRENSTRPKDSEGGRSAPYLPVDRRQGLNLHGGTSAEFSSLETLAAVATSLSNKTSSMIKNTNPIPTEESPPSSGGENGTQELRAHSDTDPSTCASRAASTSTLGSRGRSPLEAGDLTLVPKKRARTTEYEAISPDPSPSITGTEDAASSSKKRKLTEEASNGKGRSGTTENSAAEGMGNMSSDIQMDPKLLNASAMAWAALSNQIYLGMQMGMLKQLSEQQGNFQSIDGATGSGTRKRSSTTSTSGNSQGRGRPATISVEEKHSPGTASDHMDDTIESVIRQLCYGDSNISPKSSNDMSPRPSSSTGKRVGRPSKRNATVPRKTSGIFPGVTPVPATPCGLTVREQLAMKRAQESTAEDIEELTKKSVLDGETKQENKNEGMADFLPLDLSRKTVIKQDPEIKAEATEMLDSEPLSGIEGMEASRASSSERSADSQSYPRKRKVPDENQIRIPLDQGWRRQTCIRSISANGVRGDVIYYAPCGKRLGSYAEVIRYLEKNEISSLSRDNFSFSCKVLSGEFLQIKPNSEKDNGVVKLDEKQVMDLIEKIAEKSGSSNAVRSSNLRKLHESQMRRSNRNRGLSAVGRLSEVTIQQRQLLKAMELRKADRDKESQLRAQRIMDAMRRAKEQELKKQQLSMLQKQAKEEEQYYRQMLLMGLKREEMRQQVLAARVIESRKKQEERQRIIAERLIRQEEKVAARNAQQLRIKQLRQPIEDLDLEGGKALAPIERVPGLKIDGKAFADLLMVMEFLTNFGGVLKIDMRDVPSMSDVHAGIMRSPAHMKYVRKLAKILLSLVLEYPGLPPGPQSKTFLSQAVRELKITRDNMSELLGMFLKSREDGEGAKLGKLLVNASFAALSATEKAAILAYMCNELLYCRNVVREIEGNIEDTTRMKGEKWLRETKIRTLRSLQAKKRIDKQRNENSRTSFESSGENSQQPETEDTQFSKFDDASQDSASLQAEPASLPRFGTPNSVSETSESETELKSLADVKREQEASPEKKLKSASVSVTDNLTEVGRSATGTPTKKFSTPGASGPETVTDEEKKMSVEKLEEVIGKLGKEAENLMDKIADKTCRVRAQPYGLDRFHRFYWVLPNLGGVFLESIESGRVHNPAVTLKTSQLSSTLREQDVGNCLTDLVDRVCKSESSAVTPLNDSTPVLDLSVVRSGDLTQGEKCRREGRVFPEEMEEGWWLIKSAEEFDEVLNSLQFRGIRERVLHRNLTRYSAYVKKQSFEKIKPMSLEGVNCEDCQSSDDVEKSCLLRVLNAVRLLEEKVFHANIHVRTWKPPEFDLGSSSNPGKSLETEDGEEESTESSASSSLSEGLKVEECGSSKDLLRLLKNRLLKLERNIERRYLASPFHHCRSVPADVIMNMENGVQTPSAEESEDPKDSADKRTDFSFMDSAENKPRTESADKEISFDEIPMQLEKWRVGIEKSTNSSQLMLCVLQMDANIAWERSIMRASCQICQSGDNESKLLLCDGCDMGYHTYCFKPKMLTIPVGDWFCPDCISRATEQECCLLCCKQGGNFALCSECGHSFHPVCLDLSDNTKETTPVPESMPLKKRSISTSSSSLASQSWNSATWKCPACAKSPENSVNLTEDDLMLTPSGSNSEKLGKTVPGRKKSSGTPALSVKKKKTVKDGRATLKEEKGNEKLTVEEICSVMVAELDAHKDSWPFKLPVDMKVFPIYKKVIRKPMDLSAIKAKLNSHKYGIEEDFSEDVKLIFCNCKTFNEDDSPVGKAGRSLRRFFIKRWKELTAGLKTTNGLK